RVQVDAAADANRCAVRARVPSLHGRLRAAGAGGLWRVARRRARDELKRDLDAGETDRAAADVAEAAFLVDLRAVLACRSDVNEADGLGRAATAWTGNPGNGDGQVGVGVGQRTARHGTRNGLAHRAILVEHGHGHAEQLHLGFVRVGDEAALDH